MKGSGGLRGAMDDEQDPHSYALSLCRGRYVLFRAWIRQYHEAFARTGGVATLHLFPAFGGDGHRLVDRIEIWKAAADDFLRRLNLVSR